MRTCPRCGKDAPDEASTCPEDGTPLPAPEAPAAPRKGPAPLLVVAAFAAAAAGALAVSLLSTRTGDVPPELPEPTPLERPAEAPKGVRRLTLTGVKIEGAVAEEAAKGALEAALPALDGCAAAGLSAPVELTLAVTPDGLVSGVHGDVGGAASTDATVLCASQRLAGLKLPAPSDGKRARVVATLEATE